MKGKNDAARTTNIDLEEITSHITATITKNINSYLDNLSQTFIHSEDVCHLKTQ